MRKLITLVILTTTSLLFVCGFALGLIWLQGREGGTTGQGLALTLAACAFAIAARRVIAAVTPGWPRWMFQ